MPKIDKADPKFPLAHHAGDRDTLQFAETILHGKLRFEKGMVVRFEDPAVAAYFDVAFNGTEFVDVADDKVIRTITNEEINFDPKDPSGNETIDPHTRMIGREGVKDGTTVHQHLTGEAPAEANSTLEVADVVDRGTHTGEPGHG